MENILNDTKEDVKTKMGKAIESLEGTYLAIRTGRASVSLLDKIKVEVYGSLTPINQMSSISAPEPRMLVVQPYDKSALKAIEKAVRESSLGLSPNIDGNVVRIVLPELTRERREELVKHTSKVTEESKIAIRNIRRDAMDVLKAAEKAHQISEDDEKRAKDDIQKLTDDHIAKVDHMFEKKKAEILTV